MRRCAQPRPRSARQRRARRGFSLVEMLIALTITATLLTATLSALDASFKSYQHTTESASTHVVARIVMQRLTGMIRTGSEFAPYPLNPLLEPRPPASDYIEFIASRDESTGEERHARIYVEDNDRGLQDLLIEITTFRHGTQVGSPESYPLLQDVLEFRVLMEWDVGPRLRRATIDLVVRPDDLQDAAISVGMDGPTIRLLASASPQGLD